MIMIARGCMCYNPPVLCGLKIVGLGYSSVPNPTMSQELTPEQMRLTATNAWTVSGANQIYQASQTQWFEANRTKKRGPPSAAGISSSGLTTPAETDTVMEGADRPEATPPQEQAQSSSTPLIQPITVEKEAAYAITASQSGVNAQDPAEYSAWLNQRLTTRAEVLDTVRAYHTSVIRTEIQNVVLQIENIFKLLDDRVLRNHDNLQWLLSDSRQDQKRISALQVITTGWAQDMAPEDRYFMLCWMFEQIEFFRSWLTQRGFRLDEAGSNYVWMNVLQADPSTPPAGADYSSVTMLTFKAWELRQQFMTAFGGATGTPLWRDNQSQVKGRHIRVTPCSPQFQRKLEVPIRVLLSLINESDQLESNQVVVLWKTLTIMQPQTTREFDPQARAFARMYYYTEEGVLKGRLEVTPQLQAAMAGPAPVGCSEPEAWEHHWCRVVYGIQHELDVADQTQFQSAVRSAKGSGKGVFVGKGKRHWSANAVYSSSDNPFPVYMDVHPVPEIAYVWDEYCDKFQQSNLKVGSYTQATFQGAPAAPAATATPQAAISKAAASTAPSMAPPSGPPAKMGKGGSS